jgi:hypothetical protein
MPTRLNLKIAPGDLTFGHPDPPRWLVAPLYPVLAEPVEAIGEPLSGQLDAQVR